MPTRSSSDLVGSGWVFWLDPNELTAIRFIGEALVETSIVFLLLWGMYALAKHVATGTNRRRRR